MNINSIENELKNSLKNVLQEINDLVKRVQKLETIIGDYQKGYDVICKTYPESKL